jgi:HD-like signal output (HDOD) protein
MIVINRLGFSSSLNLAVRQAFSKYKYPYNINREENMDYLKKVQKAEK